MPLNVEQRHRVVEMIFPFVEHPDQRSDLLNAAKLDFALRRQINLSSGPDTFASNLLQAAENFGRMKDGRNAVDAILDEMRVRLGMDEQEELDTLRGVAPVASGPTMQNATQQPTGTTTFNINNPGGTNYVGTTINGGVHTTHHHGAVGTSGVTGEPSRRRGILFVTADPTDQARLRSGQEYRDIDAQLRMAGQRDLFDLNMQPAARAEDISGSLLRYQPNILHFSGHGLSAGLAFEDASGKAQLIGGDDFASLFGTRVGRLVNCVVLSACYSETQAKALDQYVPFVIGMSDAIKDKAAIAFSVGFYQALGSGEAIPDAFDMGVVQIRLRGLHGGETPQLIQRS